MSIDAINDDRYLRAAEREAEGLASYYDPVEDGDALEEEPCFDLVPLSDSLCSPWLPSNGRPFPRTASPTA